MPTRFCSTSSSLPSDLRERLLEGPDEIFDRLVTAFEILSRARLLKFDQRCLGEVEERLVVLAQRVRRKRGKRVAQLDLRVFEQLQLLRRRAALGLERRFEARFGARQLGGEFGADDGDLSIGLRAHHQPHGDGEQQPERRHGEEQRGHMRSLGERGED